MVSVDIYIFNVEQWGFSLSPSRVWPVLHPSYNQSQFNHWSDSELTHTAAWYVPPLSITQSGYWLGCDGCDGCDKCQDRPTSQYLMSRGNCIISGLVIPNEGRTPAWPASRVVFLRTVNCHIFRAAAWWLEVWWPVWWLSGLGCHMSPGWRMTTKANEVNDPPKW